MIGRPLPETDLAGLLSSTASEIFTALDLADLHRQEREGGDQIELQATYIRLDLPAILEYLPARRVAGGPRILGRFRVRPPSGYRLRRARRPGRLRIVWTSREEPGHGQ